ncbi:MAG: CheY-like chemotaxis protein [Candidatus Azotimanducaceae bacterium]|jgi:CheY-like chemotaxis protein
MVIDQSVDDISTLAESLKVRVKLAKPIIQSDAQSDTHSETIGHMTNDVALRGPICDDNHLIREVFSLQLARLGYVSEATRDMGKTLDRLNAENFQFLLLGVKLGEESGIDVLKRIRNSGKPYANIPVCMISGSLMEKDEALELGADNFLLKPPLRGELAEMALSL